MNNNNGVSSLIFATFTILALIVGAVSGAVLFASEKEVPVEVVKEVLVPGKTVTETVYANKTVEVSTGIDQSLLEAAQATVFDEIGDTSAFLNCSSNEFDEDEVKISRTDDDWIFQNLDDDDDKYSVTFESQYKFDDNKDIRSCKETRKYKVTYEEDEDPVVVKL